MLSTPRLPLKALSMRLPLAPALMQEETIASWIDRCGTRHGMQRSELIAAVCDASRLQPPALDLDWDVDPAVEVLAALERIAGLKEGVLKLHRLPRSPLNLSPRTRMAYCPICAASDLKRGQLPAFRREWALSVITHCRVHDIPLFGWHRSIVRPGQHLYEYKELRALTRKTIRRATVSWGAPKFEAHETHSDMSRDIRVARALGAGLRNCGFEAQATWRQQTFLEQRFVAAVRGQPLDGSHWPLGTGLPVQYAIRDLFALLICRFDQGDFWPRMRSMQWGLFPELKGLFARWKEYGPSPKGFGASHLRYLTHDTYAPGLRRTGLFVVNQWLEQLVELARINFSEIRGCFREAQIPLCLEALPPAAKDAFRRRSRRWPVMMRQLCAPAFLLKEGPVKNVKLKSYPSNQEWNSHRDVPPSISSLVPIENVRGKRAVPRYKPVDL